MSTGAGVLRSITKHQTSHRLHTTLLSPLFMFTPRIPRLCVYVAQINCSVLKFICSTLLKCTCSFLFCWCFFCCFVFCFSTHVLSSWVLLRVLRDHGGCGVGGVCRDRIWCFSVGGVISGAQDGSSRAAVRPRARLRRVCEHQSGGIDDAVVPYQCYRNLYWLSHPPPTLTERWNVRYNTQHAFSTPATQTGFTVINILHTGSIKFDFMGYYNTDTAPLPKKREGGITTLGGYSFSFFTL